MSYLKNFYNGLREIGGSDREKDFTKVGSEYIMEGERCICGHEIKRCYDVRSRINGNVMTVGSCCVKKFDIKKRCDRCNTEHKNRKDNYCEACRIAIKNEEVERQVLERQLLAQERQKKEIERQMRRNEMLLNNIIDEDEIKNERITFGKYQGRTWESVYNDKPEYVKWCCINVKFMNKNVKKFYEKKMGI